MLRGLLLSLTLSASLISGDAPKFTLPPTVDVRVPVSGTCNGSTLWSFAYVNGSRGHYYGMLYVSTSIASNVSIVCNPTGSLSGQAIIVSGYGGSAAAAVSPTMTAVTTSTTLTSTPLVFSVSGSGAIVFDGWFHDGATGSGTLNCSCTTSAGTTTILAGSYLVQVTDN